MIPYNNNHFQPFKITNIFLSEDIANKFYLFYCALFWW